VGEGGFQESRFSTVVDGVAQQNLSLREVPQVPVMVRYGHHSSVTCSFSRGREYTFYVQVPGKKEGYLEAISEENYLKNLDKYASWVRDVKILKQNRV
jgi:hypothetical protein